MKHRFLRQILWVKTLILVGYGLSCVPPEYRLRNYTGTQLDLSDPQIQQIFNLRDRNSTDSLMRFFRDPSPTYRYLSAMSFGSVRDPRAIDSLGALLRDSFADVRMAAAYALGQIGDVRAEPLLIKGFERLDKVNKYAKSNGAILEALGKCGSRQSLDNLAQIQSFGAADTAILEGQAFGLYRFALRDTFSAAGTAKMLSFLQKSELPPRVRLAAAHYFMRGKLIRLDSAASFAAARLAQNDPDLQVRIALARALGKSNLPIFAISALDSVYRTNTDWRVKVNVVAACNNFDYKQIESIVHRALRDQNTHVALAAADFCNQKGNDYFGRYYFDTGRDSSLAKPVQVQILGSALRWLTFQPKLRDSANEILQRKYTLANSASEKAQILGGMSFYPKNYNFLKETMLKPDQPITVRTAAAQGIARMAGDVPNMQRSLGANFDATRKDMRVVLFQMMRDPDVGLVTESAKILRENGLFDKKALKDSVSILVSVLQRLKIPNDFETYEEVAKTINWAVDSTFIQPKKLSSRSTDWSQIKTMSKTPLAIVKTNKGAFKIQLMPQLAPSSVTSFVKLSRAGFFNGKLVHRVVPNFVAQTGCPRGDGYGSLDFTLHSELSNDYYDAEGVVGMASAGPNTECSQWFVTHSPALHLDMNYTIFGNVIDGMAIVNDLQFGDSILGISIE